MPLNDVILNRAEWEMLRWRFGELGGGAANASWELHSFGLVVVINAKLKHNTVTKQHLSSTKVPRVNELA